MLPKDWKFQSLELFWLLRIFREFYGSEGEGRPDNRIGRIVFPTLEDGLAWNTTALYTTGDIRVVSQGTCDGCCEEEMGAVMSGEGTGELRLISLANPAGLGFSGDAN